ncbi:hypothetical protein B0H14DRAFT_3130326 [Mycena olivaceomarginata]|nr:hypothetical protein B0H14DRAFT_3130326 [Mycena olivaceomarginata]
MRGRSGAGNLSGKGSEKSAGREGQSRHDLQRLLGIQPGLGEYKVRQAEGGRRIDHASWRVGCRSGYPMAGRGGAQGKEQNGRATAEVFDVLVAARAGSGRRDGGRRGKVETSGAGDGNARELGSGGGGGKEGRSAGGNRNGSGRREGRTHAGRARESSRVVLWTSETRGAYGRAEVVQCFGDQEAVACAGSQRTARAESARREDVERQMRKRGGGERVRAEGLEIRAGGVPRGHRARQCGPAKQGRAAPSRAKRHRQRAGEAIGRLFGNERRDEEGGWEGKGARRNHCKAALCLAASMSESESAAEDLRKAAAWKSIERHSQDSKRNEWGDQNTPSGIFRNSARHSFFASFFHFAPATSLCPTRESGAKLDSNAALSTLSRLRWRVAIFHPAPRLRPRITRTHIGALGGPVMKREIRYTRTKHGPPSRCKPSSDAADVAEAFSSNIIASTCRLQH